MTIGSGGQIRTDDLMLMRHPRYSFSTPLWVVGRSDNPDSRRLQDSMPCHSEPTRLKIPPRAITPVLDRISTGLFRNPQSCRLLVGFGFRGMSNCPCAVAIPTVSVLRLSHYTNTAGDCGQRAGIHALRLTSIRRIKIYGPLPQSPCVLVVDYSLH